MRLNDKHVSRFYELVKKSETQFEDPAIHSGPRIWRGDARAMRYVFNKLMQLNSRDEAVVRDAKRAVTPAASAAQRD